MRHRAYSGLFTNLYRKNCSTIAAALAVVNLPASGGDTHGHEPRP
jgi:hypothetical protein